MPPMPKSDKIWYNGELVNWDAANVHVLSHVVHYGSSVFEGIRCYNTEKGPAVFRLEEHVDRLFDSAKIYRMEIPYTREEVCEAILETIRVNGLEACYIRPVVFRGYGSLGVDPMTCPVETVIAVWEWGQYLGDEAEKNKKAFPAWLDEVESIQSHQETDREEHFLSQPLSDHQSLFYKNLLIYADRHAFLFDAKGHH